MSLQLATSSSPSGTHPVPGTLALAHSTLCGFPVTLERSKKSKTGGRADDLEGVTGARRAIGQAVALRGLG